VKPIFKDGRAYRIRRGKMVEIPREWVGKTVSAQTINKRPSKQLHKHRKLQKLGDFNARRERAESAIRDKESRYDLDVPEGS
jgi:hypothetical protein